MFKKISFIMICFMLAGCDPVVMYITNKSAGKQEVDLAKTYIDLVRYKDFEKIAAYYGLTDDRLEELKHEQGLIQIMNYFPAEEPKGVRLIRWEAITGPFPGKSVKRTVLQLEYEFSNEWLLVDLTLETQDGKPIVKNTNVRVIDRSLAVDENAFLSSRITYYHLVFLVVMVAVFLFIVINLIRCIRAPIRKKWLWIPFILIGVGTVTLNWTAGAVNFSPFMAIISGIQVSQYAPYVPWTFSVSLPVGAIIFAIMRKRLVRRASIVG